MSTHGHWDHIGDNAAVAAHTGAEIAVHPLDRERLTSPQPLFAPFDDPAVRAGRRPGRGRPHPVRGDPSPGPSHPRPHRGLGLPAGRGRRPAVQRRHAVRRRLGPGRPARRRRAGDGRLARPAQRPRGPDRRLPGPRARRPPSGASGRGWSSSATAAACSPDRPPGQRSSGPPYAAARLWTVEAETLVQPERPVRVLRVDAEHRPPSIPASRSRTSEIAVSARARPRRRHGRRTLMCSSQPRSTPSRSFSSGQIQFWTTPATSSPSQATDPQARCRAPCARRSTGTVASVISRWPQWSRKASFSASKIGRQWSSRRPAGARARRAAGHPGSAASQVAAHQEEVADRLEAGRSASRARCPTSASSEKAPEVDRDQPGPRATARMRAPRRGPVEQPGPEPAPAERRVDRAPHLVGRHVVAEPRARPGDGDDPAVDLDQDDVVDRDRRRPRPSMSSLDAARRSAATGSRRRRWRRDRTSAMARVVGGVARRTGQRRPGIGGASVAARPVGAGSSWSRLSSVLSLHVVAHRLVDDLPGAGGARPGRADRSRGRPAPAHARACDGWPAGPRSGAHRPGRPGRRSRARPRGGSR